MLRTNATQQNPQHTSCGLLIGVMAWIGKRWLKEMVKRPSKGIMDLPHTQAHLNQTLITH